MAQGTRYTVNYTKRISTFKFQPRLILLGTLFAFPLKLGGCDTLIYDSKRYEIVTCGKGEVEAKDRLSWYVCMLDRKTGTLYLSIRAPSLETGNIERAFKWQPWAELP